MQPPLRQQKNVKKKRRSTPITIGFVTVCFFIVSSVLGIVAQGVVYYPLWLLAVILFIAGAFLFMFEVFLLYGLVSGKQYGFQGKDIEEADDEDPGDFRDHQRAKDTADA